MADHTEPSRPPADDVPNDVSSPPRPQLRLHHFFTLTAVAAVILALMGPLTADSPIGDDQTPRIVAHVEMIWSTLYTFCIAIASTVMAYGVIWRRQGIQFFDQPGHWLLVEIGVAGMLWLAPFVFFWRLEDGSYYSTAYQWNLMLIWVYAVGTFALNAYIAWKKCPESRWKSVFILKSLSFIVQYFQSLLLGDIAVLAATLIAIGRDRREHHVRDAAHWCGVGLELFIRALAIGFTALTWLYDYLQ